MAVTAATSWLVMHDQEAILVGPELLVVTEIPLVALLHQQQMELLWFKLRLRLSHLQVNGFPYPVLQLRIVQQSSPKQLIQTCGRVCVCALPFVQSRRRHLSDTTWSSVSSASSCGCGSWMLARVRYQWIWKLWRRLAPVAKKANAGATPRM